MEQNQCIRISRHYQHCFTALTIILQLDAQMMGIGKITSDGNKSQLMKFDLFRVKSMPELFSDVC